MSQQHLTGAPVARFASFTIHHSQSSSHLTLCNLQGLMASLNTLRYNNKMSTSYNAWHNAHVSRFPQSIGLRSRDSSRGYIETFPDWVDNKTYACHNTHAFRSNTKGYGGRTHYTDSQNRDRIAPNGRAVPLEVLTQRGQSGNLWIYRPTCICVSKSFRTESITKYTRTKINTRWEATQRIMVAKLNRLIHKMAITARSGREL